jgi:hypothetical protein
MLRKLLLTALLMSSASAIFAQKYMTRTGRITFNATAASSPEKIEAVNNEVASILDSKSGDLVFQAPIKSFKFQRALMQEHFNEKYMESDKYPKSEFKGTVADISGVNFGKDGSYNATATGKLTIHGVTRDVKVPGTVTVKGSSAKLTAKFSVKLADYNIEVPGVVADKLAKEAIINLDSDLVQR